MPCPGLSLSPTPVSVAGSVHLQTEPQGRPQENLTLERSSAANKQYQWTLTYIIYIL